MTNDDIVSDYTNYDYKKIFWEDGDREYEDKADRLAISRLLPAKAGVFVDVAGGYGRLADEYLNRGYTKVVVFDYSATLLEQAKELRGDAVTTVQGDIYDLPFEAGSVDALMMIRATHHFADIQKVSDQLAKILSPQGTAVIEVANKRTVVKMARYLLRKSDVNPFSYDTVTLKDLNDKGFFNYSPKYIEDVFHKSGFVIDKVLSVSNLRSGFLKKILPVKVRLAIESPLQFVFAPLRFGPSTYYRLKKK
ncbi:MAG: class I SAM-dependent methyltransferase [Propionibacteriaceae bacterium]|jgi:ubiquinone/menaquinone biosynthesis C-methylase UbiE|nr:class I SAM-dependent methyltransferase [Propionibacteriaceae bacterium]